MRLIAALRRGWARVRRATHRHVVWLGDLRRVDSAPGIQRVDSPCLECGTLLAADYGLQFYHQPRVRVLWHLDEYLPLDEALA